MSDEKGTELVKMLPEQLTGVDHDDIVAIGTSTYETVLMDREEVVSRDIENAEKVVETKRKAADKAMEADEKVAEKKRDAEAVTIAKALNALAITKETLGRFVPNESSHYGCQTEKTDTGLRLWAQLAQKVNSTKEGCRVAGSVVAEVNVPWSPAAKAARDEKAAAEKTLRDLQMQRLKIREALAKVSTMERSARAALARERLKTTKTGAAILAKMEAAANDRIRVLTK